MNIEFPVVVLKKADHIVYYYDNLKSMRKTSEDLLKRNMFKNCEIIDSCGIGWTILDVKKTGLRGLWGWHPALKGKSIWVEFILDEGKKVSLHELKEITKSKIDKSKNFWKASWDIDDLKEAIKKAQSFRELILLFK